MNALDKIHQAYATARTYPDLAQKLIEASVQSYTVDVSSGIILYHLPNGQTAIHAKTANPRPIANTFSQELTIKAIRDNQQGKTDYPTFMTDIAEAGVRFYDAILTGPSKRVVYIGIGGSYDELIPIN
ncbi:DUF1398 family protein [Spirosoma sp. SC4-14]|uniref:DUF1398 family protein n=1 Tax=Spirosoma sp. SC4-14 TaxID=3128900 RepID=UPI0030CF817F